MLRSIQVSRLAIARAAQRSARFQIRTIAVSAARQADLVQSMYLNELKNYKIPPSKPSDAKGNVLEFQMPSAPASPEEGNLASDIKSYEDQEVEVEGQQSATETPAAEEDWLEVEDEEADDEAAAAH